MTTQTKIGIKTSKLKPILLSFYALLITAHSRHLKCLQKATGSWNTVQFDKLCYRPIALKLKLVIWFFSGREVSRFWFLKKDIFIAVSAKYNETISA